MSTFSSTHQHRQIWSQLFSRPNLGRILKPNLDLKKRPITEDEELFVHFLILHLNASYYAIKRDVLLSPDRLGQDVKTIFSLPIPKAVWLKNKRFYDQEFIEFVEGDAKG